MPVIDAAFLLRFIDVETFVSVLKCVAVDLFRLYENEMRTQSKLCLVTIETLVLPVKAESFDICRACHVIENLKFDGANFGDLKLRVFVHHKSTRDMPDFQSPNYFHFVLTQFKHSNM